MAKKKTPSKKSNGEKKPLKRTSNNVNKIIIGVAVLLVVALIVVIAVSVQQQESLSTDKLLASVNGQPIYESEINFTYEQVPVYLKEQYTQEIILEGTINKILFLQDAEENGITVSEFEVDAFIDETFESGGITQEDFAALLEAQGLTFEEFRTSVKERLILEQYQEFILEDVSISDTEVNQHYQDNIEQYTAPEGSSRIRHILVEDEETAEDIMFQALDGTDFAGLAKANSIGPSAPDGGSLGFVDENTPLVEPFLEVAVELEVGEISDPVETEFGWHVIYRDTDIIPLREIRENIRESLVRDAGAQISQEKLEELKEKASIVTY